MNHNDGISNCNDCHNNNENENEVVAEVVVAEAEAEAAVIGAVSTDVAASTSATATAAAAAASSTDQDASVSKLPVVPASCVETETERNNSKAGRKFVGKKVQTAFGVGVVADFRSRDGMYVIQLGKNNNANINHNSNNNYNSGGANRNTLYTPHVPVVCGKDPSEIANQLNVAYEALEKMRRLNLDVQCHELGIPSDCVDHDMCTACLLANKGSTKSHFPRLQRFVETASEATTDFDHQVKEQFPGFHNLFHPSSASASGTTVKTSMSASVPMPPAVSATRTSNDAQLQEQFPRIHNFFNATSSASASASGMASRISASLQEASTIQTSGTSALRARVSTKPTDMASKISASLRESSTIASNSNSNSNSTAMSPAKAKATVNTAESSSAPSSPPKIPPGVADTSTVSKEEARSESSVNDHSERKNGETLKTKNSTQNPTNGSNSNRFAPKTTDSKRSVAAANTHPEPRRNSARPSAEAASARPPPPRYDPNVRSRENPFPRMRKLWGTVQSLPQPVVPPAKATKSHQRPSSKSSSNPPSKLVVPASSPAATRMTPSSVNGHSERKNGQNSTTKNPTNGRSSNSRTPATIDSKLALSARPPTQYDPNVRSRENPFPRMRKLWGTVQNLPQPVGLLNNSVTTTIFGDNKVKQDGSSADPNIIMNNRISGLANTISPKPTPVKSDKPIALPRIQRLINKRTQNNTSPCLICSSPSCPSCSSSSFRKEGITLCLKCERLFELDFIVDCVSTSDPTQRAERIEYMVDCYDRCILLLQYSKQFATQISASLEDQTKKQDIIGLASSSVGVLSGVLGIAAAASILTPAGPPLLIASLFFGGGATTVQSGTEALNYLSEPRKLADRIIALHGMSLSILRVTSTLRDAMLRDHIRTDVYEVEPVALTNQVKQSYGKNKTAVVMGSNFGRSLTLGGLAGVEASAAGAVAGGVAAGEISAVAGTSAAAASAATATGVSTAGAAGARVSTAVSRAGTAAARTIRFARFAGGALSAAVLVMEANAIHSTVKSIKEGSPCDKAETLQRVMKEVDDFPSSTDLDEECQAYLNALSARPSPAIEVAVDAVSMTDGSNPNYDEIPEAACQQVQDSDRHLCAPGAMIVDPVTTSEALPNASIIDGQPTAAAVPVNANSNASSGSSFLGTSSSLFQRLQSRREDRRDAAEEIVAVAVNDTELGESNFSLVL